MAKIIIIEGTFRDREEMKSYFVKGPKGDKGDTGPIGDNQLTIGTVESGATASAEITGTSPNQTLNLVLPKGDKGEKGDKGDTGSLAFTGYEEYDSSETYNIGDYCIYNDILYVCITDNTTGTWDSDNWTETSVKTVIDNLETNVDTNTTNIGTMQNKLSNINRFYNAWGTSITFTIPTGHQALLMVSHTAVYLLWNANDQVNISPIYGYGVSFSRGSDITQITASRSNDETWTAIVF